MDKSIFSELLVSSALNDILLIPVGNKAASTGMLQKSEDHCINLTNHPYKVKFAAVPE